MDTFDLQHFSRHLIAESLFYDEEYGAVGSLSLVDQDSFKERYIASFIPEDGSFVVEEATKWEEYDPRDDDEVGYALAIDSDEYGSYEVPAEVADVLIELAREHNLVPSITLLFEDDVV